jgi:AraC family transcriptional regulator of adaptative response/methylated-DNA-[protein]-cysteine methyltransferase
MVSDTLIESQYDMFYQCAESPLVGRVLAARSEQGLCAVLFGESDTGLLVELKKHLGYIPEPGDVEIETILQCIDGGHPYDRPLDLHGSTFHLSVWRQITLIPRGQTVTYGELARLVGRAGAVRAVAAACGSNPVAVIVPCHRVVTVGGLGGYRYGGELKRRLLAAERGLVGESS